MNITKPKVVITLSTVAYILVMPIVGYVVTTAAYVGGLSYYLGNRKPIKLIVYTVVLVAVIYAIFGFWLRVRLPSGFLI